MLWWALAACGLAQLSKLLIELGAEVHGFDYKESTLPLASFTQVDLRDPASIEAGVAGLGGGRIDALFNCAGLPTNALLISGPSKTSDIQQTLAYGAHGPRALVLLLVVPDDIDLAALAHTTGARA